MQKFIAEIRVICGLWSEIPKFTKIQQFQPSIWLQDVENRIEIRPPVYEKLTKIGRPVRNVTFFFNLSIKTLGTS